MYYCKAERQGRVKAYAGAPDQKSNAPSRGIRFCRTSTIVKEVSTDLGYKTKKCLVKSGKDKIYLLCHRSISYLGIEVYLTLPSQYIFYLESKYLLETVRCSACLSCGA